MEDQPLTVPEWVCTLVGRLVLDNEALRRALPSAPAKPDMDGFEGKVVNQFEELGGAA
jgi:hypothetical protein